MKNFLFIPTLHVFVCVRWRHMLIIPGQGEFIVIHLLGHLLSYAHTHSYSLTRSFHLLSSLLPALFLLMFILIVCLFWCCVCVCVCSTHCVPNRPISPPPIRVVSVVWATRFEHPLPDRLSCVSLYSRLVCARQSSFSFFIIHQFFWWLFSKKVPKWTGQRRVS